MAILPPLRRSLAAFLLCAITFTLAAGGRPLGERGYGPTAYHTGAARVAHASGSFLTVWSESRGIPGSKLLGAIVDADGNAVTDQPFIVADGHPIELVGTEDGFALFYQHENQLRLAHLRLDGRTVADVRLPSDWYAVAAAWTGSELVVLVLHSSSRGSVYFLGRDGAVTAGPTPIIGGLGEIHAIGDRVLVSTTDHTGIRLYNVGRGRVSAPIFIASEPASAVVVTDGPGNDVTVFWSAGGYPGRIRRAFVGDTASGDATQILGDPAVIAPIAALPKASGYQLVFARNESSNTGELFTIDLDSDARPVTAPVLLTTAQRYDSIAAVGASEVVVVYRPIAQWQSRWVSLMIVGSDGSATAPTTISTARRGHDAPILGRGTEGLIAAVTETGAAPIVMASSLDSTGRAVRWRNVANGKLVSTEIPWSGNEYLLLHTDETFRHLFATRLASDATPIGQSLYLGTTKLTETDSAARPSATWTGDHWLVMWGSPGWEKFSTATIGSQGDVSPAQEQESPATLPANHWRYLQSLALVKTHDAMFAVWSEAQIDACSSMMCQRQVLLLISRITPQGEFVGVPTSLDEGYDAEHVSVATSGLEVVIESAGQIWILDGSTAPLLARPIRLGPAAATGDVKWDGRDYVVAYRDRDPGGQWRLSLTRLNRAGERQGLTNWRPTPPPYQRESGTPSVAAVYPGLVAVGIQEAEFTDGAEAVIYLESQLSPDGAPPSRQRAVR